MEKVNNSIDYQKLKERLWERGSNVRKWARENNFKLVTVYSLLVKRAGHIQGGPVSHQIIKALKEQGLI